MFFGIDAGGTKLQFAAGIGKEVFAGEKVATPGSYGQFLDSAEEQFLKLEERFGEKITEIGIGLPGTFTAEKIVWVPNIAYLEGCDLAGDLRSRFGVEVFIGNDAQLALIGEVWKGVGRGCSNAILMSIGTGIGGAIMIDGKVVRGRRGAAGAFGWVNLDAGVRGDKNHGYLEANASGSAIGVAGLQQHPPLTSYEIVEKAREGEEFGVKVMKRAGHLLGAGLASIASILDTEMIILSGGLSKEIDTFQDSMIASFKEYTAPGVEQVPIVTSKLGNLSGAYGAVRMAQVGGDLWTG
ncbi:ROK family protein [Neobacillus muris]|uniref:ROK family protein n=1 Tax=Neobacillus muris TaxID=2941334 RepID=UPI00203D776A|nr:ROK family protein [Neobacillus muris]